MNTDEEKIQEVEVLPQKRRSKASTILALTSLLAGSGFYLGGPGPSSADIRHDPNREKTEADLKHMEAARLKRERKQKKKDERS